MRMTDTSMEEPEDDAVERRRNALDEADGTAGSARQTPPDVNEADAAEQSRAVELDDEEYR
jgi:hypothetical protein